jgi:threonine dehydratase
MTAGGLNPDVVLVQIGNGALVTGIGSWLKATSPGTQVAAAVDEVLPITDDAMVTAIRLLLETASVLAELSGAAIVAALMEHRSRFGGAAVVSVITRSNLDPKLLPRLTG